MKSVSDIVTEYLKASGFDGLYDADCGCQIADLMPCRECLCNCKPGYKIIMPSGEWRIGPTKEEKP